MAARSPNHVAFGRTIRRFRVQRGLSQEGLGLRSGIDRSYMGGVERGERNVSLTNILRIADALEVPAAELFAALEDERRS